MGGRPHGRHAVPGSDRGSRRFRRARHSRGRRRRSKAADAGSISGIGTGRRSDPRLGPYDELVTRLAAVAGEAAAGLKLFEQQACSACHTTTPLEQEKGPYLGGIFTRYSRAEVIESIVRPAAKVAQGFATNWFTTNDTRQFSGFVVREGQDDVVIRDLAGTERTLRKSQIVDRGVADGSSMPAGLVDSLSLSEFASLLAYLESTSAK